MGGEGSHHGPNATSLSLERPFWREEKISSGQTTLVVGGHWGTASLPWLEEQALPQPSLYHQVSLESLQGLDANGAYLLHKMLVKICGEKKIPPLKWAPHQKNLQQLYAWISEYTPPPPLPTPPRSFSFVQRVEAIGERTLKVGHVFLDEVRFFGTVLTELAHTLLSPATLRGNTLISQIAVTGVGAIPIVSLISFLIGVVLTFQGAFQLRKFGAELFTVDLLAVSIMREVGVLLTAIVVAGRSGSAFTAQIASMKLNQELDALRTMGINLFSFLVLPRILGLMIALPLLTFCANFMGLLGGGVMAFFVLDITSIQFIKQLEQAVTPWTFWLGLIKAPFFAFLIGMVGCHEGLQAQENAESIGTQTTKSVVKGIFLIIICDALFSVWFSLVGI